MGEPEMTVLITGAGGFVGRNLAETLRAVRDGKDRSRGLPEGLTVLEYTRRSPPEELEALCAQADFVFHLAGVNRPEREEDFITGQSGRHGGAALLSGAPGPPLPGAAGLLHPGRPG